MIKNLDPESSSSSGEYYIWNVGNCPVSVHLNLSVVDRLNTLARQGLAAMPRRGLEVGGLLLGRVRNPNLGYFIASVDQIEPIEIEHVRGPSFILSSSDKQDLFRIMRKYERKKGLSVVGFYRSHTRPGLYLDEYDYDLLRGYFAHESSVALLARPVHDGITTGGFFIWEEGEVHRASTYREFPLRSDLLRSQQPPARSDAELPDAPVPVASPLPSPSPPLEVIEPLVASPVVPSVAEVAGVAAAAAKAEPAPTVQESPPPSPQPAPSPQPGKVPRPSLVPPRSALVLPMERVRALLPQIARLRNPRWSRTAIAAAAIIIAALMWQVARDPNTTRPYNLLSLNVEPTQSGLRLTWDRNNPLFDRDRTASVVITDGTEEKHFVLNSSQLRTGAIIYWPASSDVNFRVQVGEVSESLRAIAPRLPSTAAPPSAAPDVEASDTKAPPPEVSPVQTRARTTPARETPPPSFADVEPVRGSGFKNAIGSIFGRGRDRDGFVPARAVRQVNPAVPGAMKLQEDARVSVKVSLDQDGRVKATDLVTRRVDTRLANAAMDAARRWRFQPARQQDKAVESSVILHFHFAREGDGT